MKGRCRMHQREDCNECFDWKAEAERLRRVLDYYAQYGDDQGKRARFALRPAFDEEGAR